MDIDALKAALAASPDNVPLLLLIAKTLEDRFELAEAQTYYKRTLATDPTNAAALLGMARLLDFAGESSQAMVRLESLCEPLPWSAPAFHRYPG